MLTAAKEETFSAPMVWTDECVLPLAAAGVYPKTRVWGSKLENVHCSSATPPLRIELRWGCEKSSEKTAVGSGVSFKYDPLGNRIYKSSSAGTSIYAYDDKNPIEETNASGAVIARYTGTSDEVDQPLAMLRSGVTSYFHQDGLATVTSLSNTAGALAQTYTFDSFGKQTASSGSLTNPFQYTAREFDPETSLFYYRARYYDPAAGRFISEDPIRNRGGLNYYRYVRNNATNLADPTGLYALKGFTPGEAARMMGAISQLADKLRSSPCCVDPKLRDRILNLLQPDNNGSGVTFVWHHYLPSSPGFETCAQVSLGDFLTNKVEVSAAALDGTCGCPLAGTILHETIHLTWKNFFSPNPEPGAYGGASACFGGDCSMPPGLPNP